MPRSWGWARRPVDSSEALLLHPLRAGGLPCLQVRNGGPTGAPQFRGWRSSRELQPDRGSCRAGAGSVGGGWLCKRARGTTSREWAPFSPEVGRNGGEVNSLTQPTSDRRPTTAHDGGDRHRQGSVAVHGKFMGTACARVELCRAWRGSIPHRRFRPLSATGCNPRLYPAGSRWRSGEIFGGPSKHEHPSACSRE